MFKRAYELHKAGDTGDAEALYRQHLKVLESASIRCSDPCMYAHVWIVPAG